MNFVVVGLGNPGRNYLQTRHNAGFWVVDALAEHFQRTFVSHPSGLYQLSTVQDAENTLYLVKPLTFMNLSGEALMPFFHHQNLTETEILVVVDQMDLPPGLLRFREKGGTAGHNGLKSVQKHLGTSDYPRLYFGVGRPGDGTAVHEHVLTSPSPEEALLLKGGVEKSVQAILQWVSGMSFERVMNAYNQL